MTKNIYLYNDEGVGAFSLFAVQTYFKDDMVSLVTASQIIEDGIASSIDLFIMPGGADRPYAKKLNGKGNKTIRRYVENGGTYLGICAGAYYGCQNIQFQKNTSNEICEERELEFFKGTAIGCLEDIAPAYDKTLKSASVTSITEGKNTYAVLYWGGCYFSTQRDNNFEIIANYNEVIGQPPAIISCTVGKGKAILSGVHFEVLSKTLKKFSFKDEDSLVNPLSSKLNDKKTKYFLNTIIKEA